MNKDLLSFRINAITRLSAVYNEGEAKAICDLMIEHLFLIKPHQLMYLHKWLSDAETAHLNNLVEQLCAGKPLQYLLGEAHFGPYRFTVDEHVLIPRPETYELVSWIVNDNKYKKKIDLIDIGTGSGCIPVSLAKELPESNISAFDISPEALKIAAVNAKRYGVKINLIQGDFLQHNLQQQLPDFDVIVSNPPYIKKSESGKMHRNVVEHEPHIALFVDDEDAMKFYKAIASFGLGHLRDGGTIYVELNQQLCDETISVFNQFGYNGIEPRKDLNGHWRMLKSMLA